MGKPCSIVRARLRWGGVSPRRHDGRVLSVQQGNRSLGRISSEVSDRNGSAGTVQDRRVRLQLSKCQSCRREALTRPLGGESFLYKRCLTISEIESSSSSG
jgi:hypothetical protein